MIDDAKAKGTFRLQQKSKILEERQPKIYAVTLFFFGFYKKEVSIVYSYCTFS